MLDKLKLNLAESAALKKLAKSKNYGNNFKRFVSDAKDILIILPEKLDNINSSLKIIQFLNSEKKNIYLYFSWHAIIDSNIYYLLWFSTI